PALPVMIRNASILLTGGLSQPSLLHYDKAFLRLTHHGKKVTDLFIEYQQAVLDADGDYRHCLKNPRKWKGASMRAEPQPIP
ncbi:MAG: hypothetical protein WCP58_12975, partial [bacterium]